MRLPLPGGGLALGAVSAELDREADAAEPMTAPDLTVGSQGRPLGRWVPRGMASSQRAGISSVSPAWASAEFRQIVAEPVESTLAQQAVQERVRQPPPGGRCPW